MHYSLSSLSFLNISLNEPHCDDCSNDSSLELQGLSGDFDHKPFDNDAKSSEDISYLTNQTNKYFPNNSK